MDTQKNRALNADLFTDTELELQRARYTIQKFKEYDAKRKQYIADLEERCRTLQHRLDALEGKIYGEAGDYSLSQRISEEQLHQLQLYKNMLKAQTVMNYLRQYVMPDGEYTEEFKQFLYDYDMDLLRKRLSTSKAKVSKLRKEIFRLREERYYACKRKRELEALLCAHEHHHANEDEHKSEDEV